ncbi:MAG: hypothetical protein OQK98_08255 [Gammaproteobacteria bacterium]|nr:hypothetical protein [Gammaproteobacteria bacterium]
MSYNIIWEENGIILCFLDEVTNDDLINANLEILGDPRFKKINYQLLDLINVSSYPIDSSGIRRVAELDARAYKINPDIKVALVANELIAKGLLNMYNVYVEIAGDDVRWLSEVFESIEDAKLWLHD